VLNQSENGMFRGRELEDWTNHYDKEIKRYERQIRDIDDVMKSRQNMAKLSSYGVFALVLLFLGVFVGFNSGITGMVVTTSNVTVLNVAPNLTNVVMNSSLGSNYSNETLNCYFNITDLNLDYVYGDYTWYKNNSAQLSGTSSLLTQGVFALGVTLGSGNLSKGDNWSCEITPSDGVVSGTPILNSSFVLIRNSQINVTTLEITDNGLNYSRMSLTPVQDSTSNTAIRARIYDIDGNNDQIITAYICNLDDYSACNASSYTYAKNLSYISADVNDYHYFGFNGSSDMPLFYETDGTWRLYVKAVDAEFSDSNMTDFTYVELIALGVLNSSNSSTSSINLGNGSVQPGAWSVGTSNYTLRNYGNTILSIEINASDMIGPLANWTLNNTDFAIDDDQDLSDDTGNLALVYLNNTPQSFEYLGGLLKCTSNSCSNVNATLTTYYSISPPTGLKGGTYNTTILFTVSQK
jgi:hypothetical protein